ncbi:MAG: hypothetical protein J0H46_02420 [Bacteroidetes bacterium]|nr:hypothetical protein [Bacteroidota bacterium]
MLPVAKGGYISTDTFRYKMFRYQDAYYDVSGVSLRDTQLLRISITDTMTQVVYWKRKRPWLWILSPRHLEQRVYFRNPDAHIHYSRTINIER